MNDSPARGQPADQPPVGKALAEATTRQLQGVLDVIRVALDAAATRQQKTATDTLNLLKSSDVRSSGADAGLGDRMSEVAAAAEAARTSVRQLKSLQAEVGKQFTNDLDELLSRLT